jgi:hypothetical protein
MSDKEESDGPLANLVVTIHEAKRLKKSSRIDDAFILGLPYIEVALDGSENWRQTSQAEDVESSVWDETIKVYVALCPYTYVTLLIMRGEKHSTME